MKKISQDEYDGLPLVGRGRFSAFYREVSRMKVGEILMLEPSDWTKKYHPGRTVRSVAKRTGRSFEVLTIATGEGWTVKRFS